MQNPDHRGQDSNPPTADLAALDLLLGSNFGGTIKKAGGSIFKATPARFFLVRPAGFRSINSGQAHLRPTDSKCRNLGIKKHSDFNYLNLFNFFN